MKILAVFAHPDDESYGPGGYLAKMAAEGHEVHLLTMTRGECGSLGICKTLSASQVAEMRTQEVDCAAKMLGIRQNTTLDFPDKGLAAQPAKSLDDAIREHIQKIKPEQIITFHPNGISGHTDHRALTERVISCYTDFAPGCTLLFYGLTEEQIRHLSHRKVHAMPESEIHLKINVRNYLSKKTGAINCHASQLPLWQEFNSLPVSYREFSEFEYFSIYEPS